MKTHSNSFDVLRLIAATLVIYAHTYNLRGEHVQERIQNFTGSQVSFGELALLIFFSISGYLVTLSWLRDPDVERFLQRRFLRLIPALAVVTFFGIFVVGPWLTTETMANYFSSSVTWSYLLNIFLYPVRYHLPGVFASNPYPDVVNGSIWSLRLEFSLYLIVILLGFMRLFRWRWIGALLAILSVVAVFILRSVDVLQNIPFHRELLLITLNGVPFFIGVHMAQNPGSEKASWLTIFICAGLIALFACLPGTDPLAIPIIGYFTIAFAYRFKADFGRFGDISYGLYVWGFMVQQTILHFYPTPHTIPFFLSSFIGTFVFAVLSWHFVEKTFLKLKPVISR